MGERTVTIDCDVLQGDGGTRTASITGGFVALALACRKLLEEGKIAENPILSNVAAISAGIVNDVPLLDLQYYEDSGAQVDLNCVMNAKGELIEIQGTGEGRAFTLAEQQQLVALCQKGINELIELQNRVLGG
ncbi:MAG: ribonuclease PH, partial [Clostridiales bacterium]|nr:ribonuclease PH [Clostridiales bacterium]